MNANLSIEGIDSDVLELDLGSKKEFVGESWETPLSLTAVITAGETTEEIPLTHKKEHAHSCEKAAYQQYLSLPFLNKHTPRKSVLYSADFSRGMFILVAFR